MARFNTTQTITLAHPTTNQDDRASPAKQKNDTHVAQNTETALYSQTEDPAATTTPRHTDRKKALTKNRYTIITIIITAIVLAN